MTVSGISIAAPPVEQASRPVVPDPHPTTMRLFTGLDLPPHTTASLAALLDRLRPHAALRWSPVENLHITTKFIGNWPADRLAELKTALATVAPNFLEPRTASERAGGFDVEIRGLGWFPNPHQPHTFWTAVHAGTALSNLHAATDSATAALGVSKESKAYSPHLTLARIPAGGKAELAPLRRAVAALETVEFGGFRTDRFYLYESKRSEKGSVYLKLAEFPL